LKGLVCEREWRGIWQVRGEGEDSLRKREKEGWSPVSPGKKREEKKGKRGGGSRAGHGREERKRKEKKRKKKG
jgi:hypothetical protein